MKRKKLTENEFDALVDSIQKKSFDDAISAYGSVGFERWRNPKYNGPTTRIDTQAKLTGSCGDTIELYLKVDNGLVTEAGYFTDGCASSSLCASFAAELAHNKKVEQLFELSPDQVLGQIGQFPEDDTHCAKLAIEVLHSCADNLMKAK